MLLFSSASFDQLLMRLKYMEQYSKAGKTQREALIKSATSCEQVKKRSKEQ